jgi:hypothetical protein
MFPGLFLRGQGLGFPWLFMSQQRLCALRNPCITSESSFGGYFWVGSDSVFLVSFWVNRGCGCWSFHWSTLETVLVMTSEWTATQFSLTVYESTGAMWADESMGQLWKSFGNDIWVGNDSVSLDSLCVNRCCVGCRINSSPMKKVSGAIFEWIVTQFSLTVYDSTRVVCAEESMRHLWK